MFPTSGRNRALTLAEVVVVVQMIGILAVALGSRFADGLCAGRSAERAASRAARTRRARKPDRLDETRQATGPTSRPNRAFTLAELVIVVLIIGILAVAAGPRFAGALCACRADAAAKRIKLDLELARRHAKMRSTSQSVQFNTSQNSYTLPGVPHPDHPGSVYTVKLSDTNYASTLVSANFGGDAVVVFDGYGVPDSGGTAVVRAGSYSRTVTLDASYGKVTVQ